MPIYEYRCRNGHIFEVMQRMTDDPVHLCQQCEAPVERVFHPVAVHFKGSGFYSTDYGRKKGGAAVADKGGEGEKKADSGSESKNEAATDKKPSTGDGDKKTTPVPASD